jgi:hypothetical protein
MSRSIRSVSLTRSEKRFLQNFFTAFFSIGCNSFLSIVHFRFLQQRSDGAELAAIGHSAGLLVPFSMVIIAQNDCFAKEGYCLFYG